MINNPVNEGICWGVETETNQSAHRSTRRDIDQREPKVASVARGDAEGLRLMTE